MAKVSVMTMVFGRALDEGARTDTQMFRALEGIGFDGVELPSRRLFSRSGLLDEYRTYLASSPLEVTCIDAGCNFVSPDPGARQQGVDDLRRAIEAGAALGAPLVLAAGSRLSDGIEPGEGRRMIAEGLRACQPDAEAAGLELAIENFGIAPTLQCSAADCIAVMEAAPGTAFVFDTGNFYFCGDDPLEVFTPLLRHTRHIHLKDWVKSDTPEIADVAGAPLNTGIIPNEGLVRRFLHWGVDSFSLEVGAPGDRFEAARRDLETVREWLPEPANH